MVFRPVFESNKFVLAKNIMYVEKRYLCDGLSKLNVMIIVSKNKVIPYAYKLEYSNI